jgi:peptidoglycan/xylan/chitin deacetylase (PgdA/CDA1 family)
LVLLPAAKILPAATEPGDFFTSGPTQGKKVALTFDDGPGPHTDKFLDLLDQYQVKATFFLLSNKVKNRPEMARLIAQRGHEIANHTSKHDNYKLRLRELVKQDPVGGQARAQKELTEDMRSSREVIEKTVGRKMKYLRMPYGIDGPWIHAAGRDSGFVLVNWTWGADWDAAAADKLIPGYVNALEPGAVILLHDGWPKPDKSLAITEAVLKAAKDQGLELVPVGELLN